MQGKKAGNAQSLSIFRRADERVPGVCYQHIPPAIFGLAACSIIGGTTRATAPRKRIALVRTNDTARGAPCKVTLQDYFVPLPQLHCARTLIVRRGLLPPLSSFLRNRPFLNRKWLLRFFDLLVCWIASASRKQRCIAGFAKASFQRRSS